MDRHQNEEDWDRDGDGGKDYDEDDDVPLHRKRPFGSGLKRNPIAFVRASDGDLNSTFERAKPNASVADLYLSLVLPGEAAPQPPKDEVCEVCKLPLSPTPDPEHGTSKDTTAEAPAAVPPRKHHESSLAHQVCLAHSHPPSALDRTRVGLGILASHGWDPDARAGLGRERQGIQFPLKPVPKDDKVGIGLVVPKDVPRKKEEKPRNLDAKKVRKMAQRDKKRAEALRRQFYGNPDLEKYLGPGA